MFDQLELPPELSQYLNSISPILGISGEIKSHKMFMLDKYISLPDNRILLFFNSEDIPEEISLNLLRKGEDKILISALTNHPLEEKYLKKGNKVAAPIYVHSVVSFEAIFVQKLLELDKGSLVIFKIIHGSGVAGLDPDFNDHITIIKTVEVMTLSPVDSHRHLS